MSFKLSNKILISEMMDKEYPKKTENNKKYKKQDRPVGIKGSMEIEKRKSYETY